MDVGVFSLTVDDYPEEILEITRPFLERWADKIDADLKYITKRKYPDMPPNYEKFQLYELGQDYDWQIFVDADALIPQEMFNPCEFLDKKEMLFNWIDPANTRFKFDKYFRRDSRNIGAASWFVVTSKWTLDAWRPFELQNDITFEEGKNRINPVRIEKNFGLEPDHLIDDYLVSRNIAKYGLKVRTLRNDLNKKLKVNGIMQHRFLDTTKDKVRFLDTVVEDLKNASGSVFPKGGEVKSGRKSKTKK